MLIDPPKPNFRKAQVDVTDELLLHQFERRVESGTWKVDLHNSDAAPPFGKSKSSCLCG